MTNEPVALDQSVSIPEPRRWRALTLLAIAELLGMSLWFSGSAVVPSLTREWNLSESQVSWIAIAVQLGFVAGTLLSALLNLPDVIRTRHLFAVSSAAHSQTSPSLYAKHQIKQ